MPFVPNNFDDVLQHKLLSSYRLALSEYTMSRRTKRQAGMSIDTTLRISEKSIAAPTTFHEKSVESGSVNATSRSLIDSRKSTFRRVYTATVVSRMPNTAPISEYTMLSRSTCSKRSRVVAPKAFRTPNSCKRRRIRAYESATKLIPDTSKMISTVR